MTRFVPVRLLRLSGFVLAALGCIWDGHAAGRVFRAGAAVSDITPANFPVIVNAMFEERSATSAHDPLHARCLALDDGSERLVIAVVDSCMLPRDLLDEAKRLVAAATGIPTDRMLISATHTHSAPSAMGCLGSRVDPAYARFLPSRIAEGMIRAVGKLAPARVGWGVVDDYEHTHCRRWIRRPDRLLTDPFGIKNVRANMHPGHQNPDALGPSGPVDPALSVVSVQTTDGQPLALLANYSMHYYESPLLSADYYGLFATKIARLIGAQGGNEPFVGIMSQGTSGDQMWMDYGAPRKQIGLDAYAEEVAQAAANAYRKIQHQDWAPLAMREARLTLQFRTPDEPRLSWARTLADQIGDRLPRGMAEIYAKEAIYLHERPQAELIMQAVRIGDLGIVAIPNEVYGITGLKIKAQSPLPLTFNVELANGSEGYIPPPEQHRLGGYTTWPARTAGLETNAEPRIVEQALALLEQVANRPRRKIIATHGTYARAVLDAKPVSYWRLDEFSGPDAHDANGRRAARFQGDVAFYLDGPQSPAFSGMETNRAPHLAGGWLEARPGLEGPAYTVELWVWNALPADARTTTGELIAVGRQGDRLSIGGTNQAQGRLLLATGRDGTARSTGRSVLKTREWNHVALVRDGREIFVYLNGHLELSDRTETPAIEPGASWTFGGCETSPFSLEGKLDEVAVFDRALRREEIAARVALTRASSGSADARSGVQTASDAPAKGLLSSAPQPPGAALKSLRVPQGYTVDLVAAEPLVSSPVAIDWGVDGKLWVVEMADYPYGMDGKMQPGGRVRFLEDTNGDGAMDRSTVFLTNVNFPNGLITWRKGVIITAAPDIFYAEDTDGDGKADKREVLFTGFKEGNLQLRVNGLRWGLDNWLHCANGWSGGKPRSLKTSAEINLDGRDLRIEPDRGWIEAESGQSEFGRNPDNEGNWFGCDNSYPLFHFVLEDRYMRRNPHVPAPQAKRQLYLPANPRVYPRSVEQKRYHSFEHASHFTSACSTDFYRDELLFAPGPEQHAFVCEPVHNLVQHLIVRPSGVSFAAERAESPADFDFLTSDDQWFRPVMARMGPDGALWVVDMYRYMIEHPDWLPDEGKKELEAHYRAGADRGRIYRVRANTMSSAPDAQTLPRLDQLDNVQLAAAFDSSNGWRRDKAQQMLLWRQDASVAPVLERMVEQNPRPLARLHALATLDGLNALRPDILERALQDSSPAVRRHAARLSEKHTAEPQLVKPLARLAVDPDAGVRLQAACTLGEWDHPAAANALVTLAMRDVSDPYILAAVMSSAPRHAEKLVDAAVSAKAGVADALIPPLLQLALGTRRRDLMARLLTPVLNQRPVREEQLRTFREFLDALARRGSSLEQLAQAQEDALARELPASAVLFSVARSIAPDTAQPADLRSAAAQLLGREQGRLPEDLKLLVSLLETRAPGVLQRAAVHAVGKTGDAAAADALLRDWTARLPETRAAIIEELLGREPWSLELLRRVERGEVAPLDLTTTARDRLRKHRSAPVRALAGRVLAEASNADRQRTLDDLRPVLALEGKSARGREVFARVCSVCHELGGVGREIGPNLNSVRGHPPEKLLTSIIDPSREVEPRYLAYTCTLASGEEIYGLIASETGNAIELKLADGTSRTILRTDIASLQSARVSLMPDGLEASLSQQELADLIAYLRAPAQ